MGIPTAASIYRSSIVDSETEKVSEAPRMNSMMAKQAAIYPITKGRTFLRFSSFQNRESRLGFFGILVLGWLLQVTHLQFTSQLEVILRNCNNMINRTYILYCQLRHRYKLTAYYTENQKYRINRKAT